MSLIDADTLAALFRESWNRTGNVRTAMVTIEAAIESRLRRRASKRNGPRRPPHNAGRLHPVVLGLARFWGVKPMAVVGASQFGDALVARGEAAWVLRQMRLSYPVIGAMLNRDHSSVLAAVRKIDRELTGDAARRARLVEFLAKTNGPAVTEARAA